MEPSGENSSQNRGLNKPHKLLALNRHDKTDVENFAELFPSSEGIFSFSTFPAVFEVVVEMLSLYICDVSSFFLISHVTNVGTKI